MDGPCCPSLTHPSSITLSRRQALRRLGGGLAFALLGTRATSAFAAPRASGEMAASLGNPASRVLLPGEAGLTDYGLDFALTGPPTVFFSSIDTPGWSTQLSTVVGGFVFGYAATIAKPQRAEDRPGRAIQACVHHGFPSADDANVAWYSLTAALASGAGRTKKANVRTLDLVEIIVVGGRRDILARVAADRFDAVVLASRAGATLVTIAVADFTGTSPTIDEVLELAETIAKKLERGRERDRSGLSDAFARQWTPGFTLGSTSAPFFAWPTVLDGAPLPHAGDTAATLEQRRQMAPGVRYQSHVEGPLFETAPLFPEHTLYYSGETSFFGSGEAARQFQAEAAARLRAGLPGIDLTKVSSSSTERSYAYQVPSAFGTLTGLSLQRLVTDGAFPQTAGVHLVAVPSRPDVKPISTKKIVRRLDVVVAQMGDGLERCLLAPERAPLTIAVSIPA